MIEFKGECGHTVRARDEDAGSIVRCTYCGRNASVPETRGDDLDFLFRDVEQSIAASVPSRRRFGLFRRRRTSAGAFDPFALILRMCYVAVLVIVVYVVVQKFLLPLFEEGGLARRLTGTPAAQPAPEEPRVRRPAPGQTGLVGVVPQGMYVASTPSGAQVFVVDESKAPLRGRIRDVSGCLQSRANGDSMRLPDGVYVVELVLPWNDPRLNDMNLPYYEEYREFRRAVERAADQERVRLMEEYFVPDEASSAFIHQTDEQIYLVRQFRGVEVRSGKSEGVRALFLPRLRVADKRGFSIAQLVLHAIPKQTTYAFSEDHVKTELDYYGVPRSDWEFLVEALRRIGVVPYVTPDGATRLFKIGVYDGVFATRVVREAES
jgi:hypothetical protein